MSYGWGWRPYVPVAKRRARALRYAKSLAKKGRQLLPVEITGRKIARTFWGEAWCDNLESYSDYANRLPRGRTYVRNGSVVDLQISTGRVTAIVSGSEIYEVEIQITPLPKKDWREISKECSRSIDSLIDLLQGRFDRGVMERLTRQEGGLFPKPAEISMTCSCPDWATLCKHAAAVLYGVGARLDSDPEMLFRLRDVDHLDLIGAAADGANLDAALKTSEASSLGGEDLGELFGIDLQTSSSADVAPPTPRVRTRSARSQSTKAGSAGRSNSGKPRSAVRLAKDAPKSKKSNRGKAAKAAGKERAARPSTQKKRAAKSTKTTTSTSRIRRKVKR